MIIENYFCDLVIIWFNKIIIRILFVIYIDDIGLNETHQITESDIFQTSNHLTGMGFDIFTHTLLSSFCSMNHVSKLYNQQTNMFH